MVTPLENLLSGDLSNALITFIVPFFIFFTVLLIGFKMTGLFRGNNWVSVILALGFTIMLYAGKPETFQFLATYLLKIGVAGSSIALGGAIILILITLVKGGFRIAETFRSPEEKLKNLRKEREKLYKQYQSGGIFGISTEKRAEILKQLEQKDREERMLLAKTKRLG